MSAFAFYFLRIDKKLEQRCSFLMDTYDTYQIACTQRVLARKIICKGTKSCYDFMETAEFSLKNITEKDRDRVAIPGNGGLPRPLGFGRVVCIRPRRPRSAL